MAARRSGLRRDVSGVGVGSRGVGGVAPTYGFGGARIIAASLVPACHVPSPATRGLRTDRTALAGAARRQTVPRPEPRPRHQIRVRTPSAGAGTVGGPGPPAPTTQPTPRKGNTP